MTQITASQVKELREMTGAGMMDCKAALVETAGDIEAAVDWLRKKGLAKAAKKAGRAASEGLVGLATGGTKGVVVEINSETDFVARNPDFQAMVTSVAEVALGVGGDVETLRAAPHGDGDSVEAALAKLVARIGENMHLRRAAGFTVTDGVVAGYMHAQVAPGLGKIGVLVALESTGDKTRLEAFGRQLAMHVAAANPQSLSSDDLDPALVARERDVVADQARQSGKPEAVVEKMIEGRMRKYFEEVCLLAQTFVIDGETRVEKAVEAAAKDAGAPITVKGFVRLALGEGVEKDENDFAAEVAAAARG